jgi:ribosomal-protein-serine acetyltransferase
MDDLGQIFEAVERERDRLGAWMPWVEGTRTVEDERRWLEGVLADERSLEGCGIYLEGGFVGGVGLIPRDPWGICAEIGYWIVSEHEGRGLVTRACRALIDIAFGELGLHRVMIRAGVDNPRSRAVPEGLGFTREGVLRADGRGSFGFYDAVVYGLLEDEWPPV